VTISRSAAGCTGAALKIRLLGPLEVSVQDQAAAFPQLSQRVLLAALALERNRVVSAAELVDAVWQEEPTRRRIGNLHTHICQLRRQLSRLEPGRAGSRIATQPPGYRLVLDGVECDVDLLSRLTTRARAASRNGDFAGAALHCRDALALWRGPALADITEASPRLRGHAEQLHERWLALLEERIEAELALGLHAELVSELSQLVAEYPLSEKWRCQQMLCLYRCGRQAEALACYRAARREFDEQLGLDPGPALTALHQRILESDPALAFSPRQRPTGTGNHGTVGDGLGNVHLARPVPAQLPPDIADFTGRAPEMEYLGDLLRSQARRSPGPAAVVVITGSCGAGKSALAIHASHVASHRFPDGQLYIDLRSSEPLSAAHALTRLLRSLGLAHAEIPADADAMAAEYRTLTVGRRLLVLLDNARDATQVRSLVPGAGNCAVLVTSRSWLPELAGRQSLVVPVLDDRAAMQMFSKIVGRARAAAEPEATAEILRACAGLPLAVRICASRLAARPGWSLGVLASKLADPEERLDVLCAGGQAVRMSIAASYDNLPRPDRCGKMDPATVFRLLSLADGPDIGMLAAAALLGVSPEAAEHALEVLIDANLIASPVPYRYRYHDLFRAYASERSRCDDSDVIRAQALGRVLSHYAHTTDAAVRTISPHRQHVTLGVPVAGAEPLVFGSRDEALEWLAAESACLAASMRQAARVGMYDLAWQLRIVLRDIAT
jgi:DNA-binding SARP family transcriptional activator